jgi:hypothetical protein
VVKKAIYQPPVFVPPPPPVFEKPTEEFINIDRCNHCKKKRDAWESPLVMCDICPRSFHLNCIGIREEVSQI